MEFQFKTEYNQKTMTAMARALRKTVRRKKSRRTHIFGWIIILLALLLAFWTSDGGFAFRLELRPMATFATALLLIIVLIFEDAINGYFARKKLLPGTEKSHTVFTDDEFVSKTDIGASAFLYDKIGTLAESSDYFMFVFSERHAQAYDKKSILGGTAEQFRDFIETETGKQVQKV